MARLIELLLAALIVALALPVLATAAQAAVPALIVVIVGLLALRLFA